MINTLDTLTCPIAGVRVYVPTEYDPWARITIPPLVLLRVDKVIERGGSWAMIDRLSPLV
jgi:hypothetical protein